MATEPNELHLEFLSVCGLNPFHGHDSSSRIQMFASHLGQTLEIEGLTERRIQTGFEREFAKTTFSVKMPVDGEILEIIERYPLSLGKEKIAFNPQTIVVYQDIATKELGIISLTDYCSNHQYFGFRYKKCSAMEHLYIGAKIPKDAIFLDTVAVTDDGGYMYGIEANIAMMGHPATSEDGILISKQFLSKLKFKTYETRVVEWGKNKFPLNLYGTVDNYKPFPDIGDKIRDDGILMALRSYDPSDLAPVEQSIVDTMNVDFTFDSRTYAGGPGGTIIDIRIQHDANDSNHIQPKIDAQALKYDSYRRTFHEKIVAFYNKMKSRWGEGLQITPDFQQLLVMSLAVVQETDPNSKQRIGKLYRLAPLDCFRVEFVIEYTTQPTTGFKLTGCHGDKGIICQIVDSDNMPVDEEGNRADIVMDPNSTVSRMNLGRLYEQYYNACTRDAHKKLCKKLDIKPNTRSSIALDKLDKMDDATIIDSYNYLIGLYEIISPKMHQWMFDGSVTISNRQYLSEIIEKGITLYIPPNNEPENTDIVTIIEGSEKYRPHYGKVSYIGNSGRRVTTKSNVRIASMYFMLLEKTGGDWSAVSSGKMQHFGVLAPLTKSDKYSNPARQQAVRGAGEAEVRIFASYLPREFVAEMMDRNNNPKTHMEVVNGLLSANSSTNIGNLVDRYKNPFGGAKPLVLVKHIAQCGGWEFKYSQYVNNWNK